MSTLVPPTAALRRSLEQAARGRAIAKFSNVSCSQCGGEFGAGDRGYSSCTSHLIACRLSGQIDDAQWELHCNDTEGLREEFVAYVGRRSSEVRYERGLVVAQLAGQA